jgi:glycosyltransferase involved in cell wall biosynthesis
LRHVGVPARKMVTVHNGLPPLPNRPDRETARQSFGIGERTLLLGSLGYFAPVKGFDVLLRAFALLAPRYPEAQLQIAGGDILGDTSVRLSLEKLLRELALDGRARLLCNVPSRDDYLSALDVFVVSSRTESFHLGLAEAMQFGLPSVVTSAGGCVEVARPGSESFVFTSGNPRSLAGQLEILITDPERRAALGHAALARAESYLTMTRCADDYERVYDAVLSASSRSLP